MPPFFSFQVQFQGMSILGGSSLKYVLFIFTPEGNDPT